MILNVSRSQGFQTCRRKQWFYDQGLVKLGVAEPLAMGTAYHAASAILTAKRDITLALEAGEKSYRDEVAKLPMILPEEKVMHENNITILRLMITAQGKQYKQDTWTVLKPEVEFLVELPGTKHHCWFCHQLAYPGIPYLPDGSNHTPDQDLCWQSHYLRGKTDGILSWNNLIWIMERKTSGMKQNIFWDQWYLSHQLSAYVYGARKATGLPIHGVILEKMPKPAKNQNPATFDYSPEREPYLRSEGDLREFETEIIDIAHDYERAATVGKRAFYRNPQSCINYNRRCDYWDTCKRGGDPMDGELRQRPTDYVELAYYDLLGLPKPDVKEVHDEIDSVV